MIKNYVVVICLFLLAGCGKNVKSTLPVIDLSEATEEVALNVEELVDSLQFIPLETGENCLVPEYFKMWEGEKYILISTREMILQFSKDGRFIRQLAYRGRAPEEYADVAGLLMDEAAGMVYVSDNWRGRVKKYDLLNGGFVGVNHWKYGVMTQGILAEDNSLVYLPYLSYRDTFAYEVCRVTKAGEWISGVKASDRRERVISGTAHLQQLGNELHFKPADSDTLFVVRDSLKIPEFVIAVPNPYTAEKKAGNMIEIVVETADVFILRMLDQKVEEVEGGIYCNFREVGKYIIYKKEGTVKKLSKIYTSCWGGKLELPTLSQAGKYLHGSFTRYSFLPMLDDWQQQERPDSVKLAAFRTFWRNLQVDDNPVVVSGKIRN